MQPLLYGSILCLLSADVCSVLFVATQYDGSAARSTTCNVGGSLWFVAQLGFHSCPVMLWLVQTVDAGVWL